MKKFIFSPIAVASLALFSCQSQQFDTKSERAPSSARRPASFSERFERRLEKEEELVTRIKDGILFLQSRQANASGKVLRGTHAKGVCVGGSLEIADLSFYPPAVSQRLKMGMFSVTGKYPVQLRFANAEGKIQADQEPDVRAVSFSVKMPQELSNSQGLMDFAMNNAPTFPIDDAKVFADLMTVAKEGLVKGAWLVGVSGMIAVKNALTIGGVQKQPASLPYQKMRYWSNVPFALGSSEAVKYSLKPCANNSAQALSDDPDTLSKELFRHIRNDSPGCFDFQVQLLEAAKMTDANRRKKSEQDWVESAAVEWPEAQAPFYTVGRINLAKDSAVEQTACDQWKINVITNSNETHRGMGSINRARSAAEAASAEERKKAQ